MTLFVRLRTVVRTRDARLAFQHVLIYRHYERGRRPAELGVSRFR
jgi:hypothetical protein